MEDLCFVEEGEEPDGLVLRHTVLAGRTEAAAAQLRLVLRMRATRGQGGNVVPFDRRPHAAGSAGVEG